jgi:group II intron reverse transcriptase/maturase
MTARYETELTWNLGEPVYSRIECSDKLISGENEQEIVYWQSDYFIVAEKQSNVCGAKGITEMRRGVRDTSAGHRTGSQMRTKLTSLTLRAKKEPNCKFISLAHILTSDFLRGCFKELKRDKASGIDGVDIEEYEANLESNLKDLVDRMKGKRYIPKPVKRVYIPKGDGRKRGLGIPTVEDKVVQMGIKKILESIFEVDFLDVSYGFRPNRSPHDALNRVDKAIMCKPVSYVADMDIKGFFDNVGHDWMMRCLQERVKDTSLLRLIKRILKAGIMDEGKLIKSEKGTPQGGVLSPLLANIYLHFILDLWFEIVIKKKLNGYAELIRFADDFVVCFQYKGEAKWFEKKLKERLEKFGLEISERKSKVIEFGRYPWMKKKREGGKLATFDFLGFTHYCDKTRKGKFKLGRKTARKKFKQKVKELNDWFKRVRNVLKFKELWQKLRRKLIGHYNYYGMSGNSYWIYQYYKMGLKLAHKWLNRRSEKKSYNYKQYNLLLKYNPLPKPKIYHSIYSLSS